MANDPRFLDMTPDGQFRTPPRVPVATRVIAAAVLVAVVAGGLALAAFALWLALLLIPVAIVAALVAVVAIKLRLWRAHRAAGSAPGGAVHRRF